jgi:hypothetical protein
MKSRSPPYLDGDRGPDQRLVHHLHEDAATQRGQRAARGVVEASALEPVATCNNDATAIRQSNFEIKNKMQKVNLVSLPHIYTR